MRWTVNYKNPHVGDFRITRRFLWLPKQIGDEVRWLEFASWHEEYTEYTEHWFDGNYWKPITWTKP